MPEYHYVRCFGLHGTYDDGLEWLQRPENVKKPKAVLSLGSSIGNFTRDEAAGFIRHIFSALDDNDKLFIALDGCQDAEKVYHAYNDCEGFVPHEALLDSHCMLMVTQYHASVRCEWIAACQSTPRVRSIRPLRLECHRRI